MALVTDRQRIQHLLRRAGFGYSPDELSEYLALGLEGAIDRLLNPELVDDGFAENAVAALRARALQHPPTNTMAWHTRMVLTNRPLLEKMTFFWHDHFANSYRKVNYPGFMLLQNETLRAGAMGKFRDLTLAMTRDPAMLWYLDNRLSSAKAPNENFARELFELFTLGEGVGYTEKDIRESARALTGWRTTQTKPPAGVTYPEPTGAVFMPKQFDSGIKTVLGKTGRFGDEDVIRIVTDRPECAELIGRKMWQFFAVKNPTPEMLARTTKAYFTNDTSIREMLRVILRAPEMYSDGAYRWRIKSPVEHVVQTVRTFGLIDRMDRIKNDTTVQGQELFDPPTVAGWDWGYPWINSNTVLARASFANDVVRRGGPKGNPTLYVDVAALLSKNGATSSAETAVDFLLDLFVGGDVDTDTRKILIDHIGGVHYKFADANREGRLQGLLYLVLAMPLAQMA